MDESFGGVSESRGKVGDVATGDMFPGCREENLAELDLPSTTEGGWLKKSKGLLCFPGEGFPVRLMVVGVGDSGRGGRVGVEGAGEVDEDGEVVRVKGGEGGPF